MHFTYFLIPALASAVALEARQEYRWCEGELISFPKHHVRLLTTTAGEKINAGSLRKCMTVISPFERTPER
jgi:hypothetical protein